MTESVDEAVTEVALARPDPKLIQELFDTDPLKLSDQDLNLIISELRKDREAYLALETKPKATKGKASTTAKAPAIPVNDQLALSDLGL